MKPKSLIGAIQILKFSDGKNFSLIPSWCDPRNNYNMLNHVFAMQLNKDYLKKDISSCYTNLILFILAHVGLIWFGSCAHHTKYGMLLLVGLFVFALANFK